MSSAQATQEGGWSSHIGNAAELFAAIGSPLGAVDYVRRTWKQRPRWAVAAAVIAGGLMLRRRFKRRRAST